MTSSDALVVRDPWLALSSLTGEGAGDRLQRDSYETYLREWRALQQELDRDSLTRIPPEYDVERSTTQMLCVMVRWRRPKIVLETGIATEFLSYSLFSAVKANGFGIVHPCDVDPAAGEFVHASLKSHWMKHVIDGPNAEKSFVAVIREIETADVLFHDSDHREQWMEFEFRTVLPKMSLGAVLGSHDVDLKHAFLSVLSACSKSVIVLDSRKTSAFAIFNG